MSRLPRNFNMCTKQMLTKHCAPSIHARRAMKIQFDIFSSFHAFLPPHKIVYMRLPLSTECSTKINFLPSTCRPIMRSKSMMMVVTTVTICKKCKQETGGKENWRRDDDSYFLHTSSTVQVLRYTFMTTSKQIKQNKK